MSLTPTISLPVRLGDQLELWQQSLRQFGYKLRVALPGFAYNFDAVRQVCSVQLAIRENMVNPELQQIDHVAIDDLTDVPVLQSHAGGFSLTLPIPDGTECLVIFADRSIDDWWQSSKVGNQLAPWRTHDLSDGFVILGPWSQKNVKQLVGYSANTAQFRKDDGTVYAELAQQDLNLVAPQNVTITCNQFHVKSSTTSIFDNLIETSGYATRTGVGGSYTGHWFNFDYSGGLQAWIDYTNLGMVQIISDYRLKQYVEPLRFGRSLIDRLKPITYELRDIPNDLFKSDGKRHAGLIAHEVQEVIPSAINGEKDAMTEKGTIQPQTLNLVDLLAVLIAAVQDLSFKMGIVEEHLNL